MSRRRIQGMDRAAAVLATALLIPGFLAFVASPAGAAPGSLPTASDYTENFVASAPTSYYHVDTGTFTAGGGAYDAGKTNTDIVSSLQSGDYACGDVVSFLTLVGQDSTTATVAAGEQTLRLTYDFTAYTTGQQGVAIDDIVGVYLNKPPEYIDLTEPTHTSDSAYVDPDADATISETHTFSGNIFTKPSDLLATVTVGNFAAGESLVVRVDVHVACQVGSNPTGNLQASMNTADIITVNTENGGTTLNPPIHLTSGQQTVNLKTPTVLLAPSVALNKLTNGADGATILKGTPITWTYAVTNTGNVALSNVAVTDNRGVVVTCGNSTLAAGATETCTATGTAIAGNYSNIGTVNAAYVNGSYSFPVTASDPSSYFGADPKIAIDKVTNGSDGPTILLGDTVTWTYVVTNTGNVPLTSVAVTDDKLGAITCGSTSLAVGASETCTATGVATKDRYDNTGSASAMYGSTHVTASDPSWYFGAAPAISLSKLTNGVDSATILVGETVTWTYLVTNTGNVPLTGLGVIDDKGVTVTCPSTTLALSASVTCSATGIATANWYHNIGTATAYFGSTPATASDPSSYFGAAPAITIDKRTNGSDGVTILAGDTVTWTYIVTNTGNTDFVNVAVTDSKGVSVSCPSTTLAVGASETCTATGSATAGRYDNTGTVTGTINTTGGTRTVTASDPSWYFGADPAISINKTTNGGDGVTILAGDTVTWTYIVTNTGNVALSDVGVTDNKLAPSAVSCPSTTLAVGASETCTATGIAAVGNYDNIGTASGGFGGRTVTNTDASSYFGASPSISLSKLTNGVDSATILVGETVTWTYLVTNTGNVPLTGLGVIDDKGVTVICPSTTLALSASVTCSATGIATANWYHNLGTATAYFGSTPVTASDPSSYFGAAPAITIDKRTNGADGLFIRTGDTVTWTYLVTNTGNVDFVNVQLVDDKLGSVTCPTTTLGVGASETCTASGLAAMGAYDNLGTVTGTINTTGGTRTVTASDPSSYFGASPAIAIDKTTNGADGLQILIGETVTWTYVVTNTGNVALTGVAVSDDKLGAITCPDSTLAVGASETCTTTGVATKGAYDNLGTATGHFQGDTVTATDASSYFGAAPAIAILKAPATQTVDESSTATFTITVTNTGNVPLTGVVVTDPLAPNCASTIGALAVGETTTFTCTLANIHEAFTNVATATGYYGSTSVTDSHSADVVVHYLPVVHVTKTPSPTSVPETGSTVQFTVVVSNVYRDTFTVTSLVDSVYGNLNGVGTCATGTTLVPGASYTCTFSKLLAGDESLPHSDTVTVVGTDAVHSTTTDNATASVGFTDVLPRITITKVANPTLVIAGGGWVDYTVTVTNNGTVPETITALTDIPVPDTPTAALAPCTALIGTMLAPSASTSCVIHAWVTGAAATTLTDTATVVAADDDANTATASASATVRFSWYGRTPGYWKNHPLNWPAPYATTQTLGSVFTFPSSTPWTGKPKSSDTLLIALGYQGGSTLGGKAQILLRAAVAALLNKAYYGALYPAYPSIGDLVAAVNTALQSGSGTAMTTLASTLDYWNNGNEGSI